MTDRNDNLTSTEQWLLDYALGLPSGPKPARVDDAEVERVGAAMAALARWQVSSPAGLEDRILAAAKTMPVLRVVRPQKAGGSAESLQRVVEARNSREVVLAFGGLRDVLSVAAVLVLMVGLGVPGIINMKARNYRIGCAANLGMIGQGLQSYATTYGSSLPFAGWGSDRSWRPTTATNLRVQPNRQHLEPLATGQFVSDVRRFLCPSGCDIPMTAAQMRRGVAFADARNVSFAYFNMAGVQPGNNAPQELPILADDNPLFDNGTPRLDVRRIWKSAEDANSNAHRGAGQNVLSIGGHVRWTSTPHSGINGDNIWTLNAITDYTGREGPTSETDSHLLK